MRHRSTKERRQERYEFLYMYRREFEQLLNKESKDADVINFVEKFARPLLTYKCNTYYFDIYMTLKRDYKKLFTNVL